MRYKKQYPKNQLSPANARRHPLRAMAAIALVIGLNLYSLVMKIIITRTMSVVITQMEFIRAIVPYVVW